MLPRLLALESFRLKFPVGSYIINSIGHRQSTNLTHVKNHTIFKSRILSCYGSLIRYSRRMDTRWPFQIQPSGFLPFYLLLNFKRLIHNSWIALIKEREKHKLLGRMEMVVGGQTHKGLWNFSCITLYIVYFLFIFFLLSGPIKYFSYTFKR